MTFGLPSWRSLKTRVVVMALSVFVLSIMALAFFADRLLREDMQRLIGNQLFSTVTMVASEIDKELSDRTARLGLVAQQIKPAHMVAPATLQLLLEADPLLQELFSGGTIVLNIDAIAIASVPTVVPGAGSRVGVSYADRGDIVRALKFGKAVISEPNVGKVLKVPVVSLAVPIRDGRGTVIGALVGVVDLTQPNFLNSIVGHLYGSTGGYLVVDPKHNLVVTGTDKTSNLQVLSPKGANLLREKYLKGYEGYGIFVDAKGIENLSAAHSIATSGWYVMAMLHTDEAFSPIRSIELRIAYLAVLLTLLAGGIGWWILHRELVPVVATASALASLRQYEAFPDSLKIYRNDEVGDLIRGFNGLLDVLRARGRTLKESEALIREAQVLAGLGSYVFLGAEDCWISSPVLDTLLGIDGAYKRDLQGWLNLIHVDERQALADYFSELVNQEDQRFDKTYRIVRHSDGAIRWVHGLGHLEYDPSGHFLKMNGTIQDVTQTVLSEQRLRNLSRITEQAPLAIVIANLSGTIEYVNPQFESITGFAADEVIGRNPRVLQSGKTAPEVYANLWETLQQGHVWRGEFVNRKKDGQVFVERAVIAPVYGPKGLPTHYVALKEDITEQKQQQQELQASLREKTALLNEVHHRVKNNLQVITSLLRLEAGKSSNSGAKAVLAEMVGRIRSMALVHETLYRSGTFASVDLHTYLQKVATEAFRAQVGNAGAVRLVLKLAPVTINLDMATPCGLLVNELISNCLKHAFVHGEHGEVSIELYPAVSADPNHTLWCLRVRDTGVGLPADFEARRAQSLGLQLVSDLANQLGGSLVVEHGPGAGFSVTFPIGAT